METAQGRSTTGRIALVGFMGAGKTTIGRILAGRLACAFVDLDDVIRQREGREIAAIFRDSGEPYFRRLESECLRGLMSAHQAPTPEVIVVALGGGAFAQAENAALLRSCGALVVFLDAPIEELRRRCRQQGNERPLFGDENQFRQLYETRRGSYMAAGLRVDTVGKTPEQVAEQILQISGLKGRE